MYVNNSKNHRLSNYHTRYLCEKVCASLIFYFISSFFIYFILFYLLITKDSKPKGVNKCLSKIKGSQ